MRFNISLKTILTIILLIPSISAFCGCGGNKKAWSNTEAETMSFNYSTEFDGEYFILRNGLVNTYNKIKNKEDITISFLGGSITYGVGTDNLDNSFRVLVKNWISDKYGVTVNEYNAAIPSACSGIGAYCVESDALIHNPDIVFVEYAINDKYARENYNLEEISVNMETIVRKVRVKSPNTDIIFLYTTAADVSMSKPLFEETNIHEQIAEHYGVTSINIGYGLRKGRGLLKSSGSDAITKKWLTYFADSCHTNNNGNIVYADIIKQCIESAFTAAKNNAPVNTKLPKQLNKKLIDTNYIKTSQVDLEGSKGFKKVDTQWSSFTNYNDGYIYTNTADNELDFTFNGTSFGILGPVNRDYKFSVDGGEWKEFSKFNSHPQPLVKGLEKGEHTIRIIVPDADKVEFIISAFLIGS